MERQMTLTSTSSTSPNWQTGPSCRLRRKRKKSPLYLMLHNVRMSGSQDVDKNVTKSNWVSLRVCVTRFYNDFVEPTENDKNDRFRLSSSGNEISKWH